MTILTVLIIPTMMTILTMMTISTMMTIVFESKLEVVLSHITFNLLVKKVGGYLTRCTRITASIALNAGK